MTKRSLLPKPGLVLLCCAGPWLADLDAQEPNQPDEEAPTCQTAVLDARQAYEGAHFSQVIKRLLPCLKKDALDREQRGQASELLALAYLDMFDEQSARLYVGELLDLRPDFAPDRSRQSESFAQPGRRAPGPAPAPTAHPAVAQVDRRHRRRRGHGVCFDPGVGIGPAARSSSRPPDFRVNRRNLP